MLLYDTYLLPRLTHMAMRHRMLLPYRRRALSQTHGRVLEIGIGSGANLPFYPAAVDHVVGIDPSTQLLGLIANLRRGDTPALEVLSATAEALPFDDRSFDCAVASWTLCSVGDPWQALCEIRRVLKPGGLFCFVEHGLSPDPRVKEWQRRLTPLWRRCAGNCHLDRAPADLVRETGLRTERLATGYAPGPRPFVFMYEGISRRP